MQSTHSPRHGLTQGERGWYKRINGKPRWIVSLKQAPTAEAADAFYESKMTQLWTGAQEEPVRVPDNPQQINLADLCNLFLDRKERRVEGGKLQQRSYDEYNEVLQAFTDHVARQSPPAPRCSDLTPLHFGRYRSFLETKYGIDRQAKSIIIVRSLFKWSAKPPLRLPLMDYGEEFDVPGRSDRKKAWKAKIESEGMQIYEPEEVFDQIQRAGSALKAMILLACNAGFANTDVAELPLTVIEPALADGWIDYMRGKTGADRRAWLWPETRKAIRDYLKRRPSPQAPFAHLLFVTSRGLPYLRDQYRDGKRTGTKDQVSQQYTRLLDTLEHRRRGFRSLRRTYRTVAEEIGGELAIDYTMGHAGDASEMKRIYTQRILDTTLMQISEHVRQRLLIAPRGGRRKGAGKGPPSAGAGKKRKRAKPKR